MNDAQRGGIFSNWKRWQVDTENSYRQASPGSYELHRTGPQPVIANASRSDPESLRCGVRNYSKDDYRDEKAHPVSTWNNTAHPRASGTASRTAACQFSRCSSYTEGFRTENEDDEPNDTLVWDSNQSPYSKKPSNNNSKREVSVSDDESRYSMSSRHTPTSKPSLYDGQLAGVAQQLEKIKTTQDSILSELSNDISSLQYENVQLKNTNEHLTMQNSHLLQVIHELSQEVESMRQIFRNRGWSVANMAISGSKVSKDTLEKSSSKSKSHQSERVSSGKSKAKKEINDESNRFGVDDTLYSEGEELAFEYPIPGDDQARQLSNTELNSFKTHHHHKSRKSKAEKHKSGEDKKHGHGSHKKKEELDQDELEPEVEEKQGCLQKLFNKKPKKSPRPKNNELV